MTDKTTRATKRTYKKTELTPAKKKFAEVYAKTDNASEAVRQAFESAPLMSQGSISVKATRLLRNDSVSQEIANQKIKMEKLATKAVEVIGNTLLTDDERLAYDAGRWVYEQTHGKATQRTESISAKYIEHVTEKKQVYNL
jgi:phage terminase small subunit